MKLIETSYALKDIYKGHFNTTYKGVPALKCPFDYFLYQMLIWEVQPDLIIEIGTFHGGSTLYLADLLKLNGKGIIHTVDRPGNEEHPLLREQENIRVFNNGYEGYDVSIASGFKNILVIEDGSHMYSDTINAMKKFAPLVSKNSYLIVEDGIIDQLGMKKKYDGGPQRAIKEFLATSADFEIDRKWIDFFGRNATFNQNGYLKRIA